MLHIIVGLHVYGSEVDPYWHPDPIKLKYLVLSPSFTNNDYLRIVNAVGELARQALGMDLAKSPRPLIKAQKEQSQELYDTLCCKRLMNLETIANTINVELQGMYLIKLQTIDISQKIDLNPEFLEDQYLLDTF